MNKNIFIIDKEANTLFSLKSMLSEAGFAVASAESFWGPEKIVEEITNAKSRLVIIDIDLSGDYSWIDLLHCIKGDENLKSISVIIYTSNQDADIKKRTINNGADYFFSKNDLTVNEFFKKMLKIYNNIIKK